MGNFSTPPLSLPLSLALAYTVAVVVVRLDCALVRIRAAEARVMNWVLAAILNRKLPEHAGILPTAGVASGHVDFGIILKTLCSSEYIWKPFLFFFFCGH